MFGFGFGFEFYSHNYDSDVDVNTVYRLETSYTMMNVVHNNITLLPEQSFSSLSHSVVVYCFHVGLCGHRGTGVSVSQVGRVSQAPRERMVL